METLQLATFDESGDASYSGARFTIVPPYVNDVSHPALVKWKRERQEYEDAIEARCAATGEDKSKALRSVKNWFNREHFKTLCKFEWGTTVDAITEDIIVSELDNIIGNVMNDVIVDVDVVFDARLKMDLLQRDVKARVINYFMLCDEIIMEHGLASTFATATGIKEKCRILEKHLAPAALRDAVDTHIRLVDSTSKSDENALYALVKEKSLEQAKVEQLLSTRKHQPSWTNHGGTTKGSERKPRHNGVQPPSSNKARLNNGDRPPGPVRCHDLKRSLIVGSDPDEFLVGKLLLAELGIDVDHQLEYLAVRGDDDKTFDEPQSMPLYKPTIAGVVMKVVDALVSGAIQRGVIDDYITTRLYTVLHRFGGWRLEVSDDPPARVPPLKIRLKAGASPYRCKVRQYSPEKSEFLDAFNKKLVELGWVFENRESRWCCPALPVKKPSSNEYRQTIDYRPTNALTEPIAGVMPNIEVALEHCRGMMFYAMLDFLKAFWQLPLHESCREYLSYMTDRGIFTPTRVPQGSTDAALHFQSTVQMALEGLVDAIHAVLQKLDEFGFILNRIKCSLFMTEVRWCGRIINKDGIGHDPSRIQALMDIPPPTTAAELQQFICASNWMRANLADYTRVARPLQERLDSALSGTKKTKRAAAGVRSELTV
ncbi:unnamed protein product [Phytophthora fragariaefolia]|uniref:Unnamed protein product n=1 Tax=Phytophthora fragariaefolia TaxID=1490495 RepID=A0A9W6X883_9STRA|nr:unnamed protein product [Phytophthora fragariaefolia]